MIHFRVIVLFRCSVELPERLPELGANRTEVPRNRHAVLCLHGKHYQRTREAEQRSFACVCVCVLCLCACVKGVSAEHGGRSLLLTLTFILPADQ